MTAIINGATMTAKQYVNYKVCNPRKHYDYGNPRCKTTTTIIYKDGNFWGKCVSREWSGAWKLYGIPEQESVEYDLTVGDVSNFWNIYTAIVGEM